MNGRTRDNWRIAAKVVGVFAVLSGILFVVRIVALSVRPDLPVDDLIARRPSIAELIANTVYAVFLFLTFVAPLLVLRSELRRRRRQP